MDKNASKMKHGGFRGVSLKAELVDQIEDFVEESNQYRSIADFVSESVRLRLQELCRGLEAVKLEPKEAANQ